MLAAGSQRCVLDPNTVKPQTGRQPATPAGDAQVVPQQHKDADGDPVLGLRRASSDGDEELSSIPQLRPFFANGLANNGASGRGPGQSLDISWVTRSTGEVCSCPMPCQ